MDHQKEADRLRKELGKIAAEKEAKRRAKIRAARVKARKKEFDDIKEHIRRLQQEDSEEEREDTYIRPSSVRSSPAESSPHRSRHDADNPTQPILSEHQQTGASDTNLTTESLHEMMVQQRRLIDAVGAPRLEMQSFNGDLLQYWPFLRAFDENIKKVVSSES